jgi:NitT/TauT family transport system permease protein
LKKISVRLWAVLFWLAVWQIAAMAVGQQILLASPAETIVRWLELILTAGFWKSVLFTLGHILAGFFGAVILGALSGALSARHDWLRELLAPLLTVIKSVPVASFVIVALIWLPSRRLSVLISFLITLPLIYTAVLDGLNHIDPKLREMAQVFRMSPLNRLLAIELPAVLPRLTSAAGVAIGLAWKSGVAAEVIGIPAGSVGERLYKAKVYLATPDLFAWTLTIVLASMLCERALRLMLKRAERALERM